MKEFWTSLVSLLGVLASLMNILQVVFPPELWCTAFEFLNRALSYFSSYSYCDVTEIDRVNTNELYNAVQLYLSSFVSPSASHLSLTRTINSSTTTFGLSNDDSGAPDAACGGEDGNNNTITLSGLLNFTDDLSSCCGSERIFVFTTNHMDKLDPALLRQMDMHIYMTYCSYPALKILLRNYLGSEAKDLGELAASELPEAVEKAKMTPADISKVLLKNWRNKEKAVSELLEVLKARAKRNERHGGLRECEPNGVEEEEEEEQEKRVLGSPRAGSHWKGDSSRELDDDEAEMLT